MNPGEAITILEQATATFKGTRDDHVKIQEALRVLVRLTTPQESEPKPKKK